MNKIISDKLNQLINYCGDVNNFHGMTLQQANTMSNGFVKVTTELKTQIELDRLKTTSKSELLESVFKYKMNQIVNAKCLGRVVIGPIESRHLIETEVGTTVRYHVYIKSIDDWVITNEMDLMRLNT